jgi:glycosyltransferase involved in cell wall biosynthesis
LKLQNKNILLISPEPWDHIFVSKHHYATHLADRGNQVFFLNPPSKQTKVEKTGFEHVYSIHYKGFIKGLRFFPAFLQRYLIRKKFEQLQKLCQVKFDMVWSFDNSVFFDFSALPDEVYCISHIVDLNQDFEFEKAAKTADLCIGVIQKIVTKQLQFNPKSYLIGHGVQMSKTEAKAIVLPGKNQLKALYIGNLQMPYIDWELLLELVKEHIQVDFIFLGSDNHKINGEAKNKLFELTNVYYLNQVGADSISNYLSSADLLLLAYTQKYYEEYASPHKMMEYLASGKMIIATWTEEYEKLINEELIEMSKSRKAYLNKFKSVIENLTDWNSEMKSEKRKSFALMNTYTKQIEKIEQLLH